MIFGGFVVMCWMLFASAVMIIGFILMGPDQDHQDDELKINNEAR